MKFILGEKSGMSQIFKEDGTVVPITLVSVKPNIVIQIKNSEKDGYSAIQLGYIEKKKLNKSEKGHFRSENGFKYLREFIIDESEVENFKIGQEITASIFKKDDKVKVSGLAKGKGFTGVVKRHGFSGSPASHGHKDQLRMPGSIGAASYPARVIRGKKMAGRVGQRKSTAINLDIIKVDTESGQLAIKGACPGPIGSLLLIQQV